MVIIKFMLLCILGLGLIDFATDMTIDFKWKTVLRFILLLGIFVLIYKFL